MRTQLWIATMIAAAGTMTMTAQSTRPDPKPDQANPNTTPDRQMDHSTPMQPNSPTTPMGSTRSAAQAQAQSGANRLGSADNSWVMKVANGGLAEVELGKLAQSQGSSEAVKQFGKRMVDDHSKANEELSQIASRKGITLPTSLDAKHQATRDRLAKLSGAAFDRAYMDDMVKDHREDVAEFKKEASNGQDSDVKAFAAKTLPTLEDHLKMAEQTDASVDKK